MNNLTIYFSGEIRTFFYCLEKTLKIIKLKNPKLKLDAKYSFWNSLNRIDKINDPWHYTIKNYEVDIDQNKINNFFIKKGFDTVEGHGCNSKENPI